VRKVSPGSVLDARCQRWGRATQSTSPGKRSTGRLVNSVGLLADLVWFAGQLRLMTSDDGDDGTPGKKPPSPLVSRQAVTLILRQMRQQARLEGLNPDLWAHDDYAVIDPDIARQVGRICRGDRKWKWLLETELAPPPNGGLADTLEEAAAAFKRRYAEVTGRT
jgi:hypothetical protein